MYKPHPECTPPQPQERLWRYMNLPKLLDLLETQELFFTQLSRLEDGYEGALSSYAVEGLRQQLQQLGDDDPDRATKVAEETYILNQHFTYVSCWHLSEHESMAMWKQYGDDGIAIQSSFARFRAALSSESRDVCIGKVKYGHYPNLPMNFGNTRAPVFHKRQVFDFEREARAALMALPQDRGPNMSDLLALSQQQSAGVRVRVDVKTLIEQVYVSPGKPEWYRSTIERVLDRYEYKLPLENSAIDQRPDFNRS